MLKIPPDYTFLIQIGLFVVFWLAMKRLLFGPALLVIGERAARSEGAIRQAQAMQAEAERLRAAGDLRGFRAVAQARRQDGRERARRCRRARCQLRSAHGSDRVGVLAPLGQGARPRDDCPRPRQGLRVHVEEIAREVVRKVLGRAA